MNPYYQDDKTTIYNANCLDAMRSMPDNSVDSIVTDPPYGLSFMGKKWDYDVPSVEIWREALRVLKPGGYLLSFAGTRTQHRMACNIEDAGFEIRDMIAWIYGSGFPKSLNIGKAVDKVQGNEREVVSREDVGHDITGGGYKDAKTERKIMDITKGNSAWEGWGTALKPAIEPITMARKPLGENTVAANVLKWGTGGINVDGCRVEGMVTSNPLVRNVGGFGSNGLANQVDPPKNVTSQGRFPANLIHDGSQMVLELFPEQKSGANPARRNSAKSKNCYGEFDGEKVCVQHRGADSGSAARFFYCSKTSKKDRNEGCDGLDEVSSSSMSGRRNADKMDGFKTDNDVTGRFTTNRKNHHPTVKPTDLMRYLCRLVTQPNGIVLDPFMGSGSTGKACMREGFRFIGCEMEEEYCGIATKRIQSGGVPA